MSVGAKKEHSFVHECIVCNKPLRPKTIVCYSCPDMPVWRCPICGSSHASDIVDCVDKTYCSAATHPGNVPYESFAKLWLLE